MKGRLFAARYFVYAPEQVASEHFTSSVLRSKTQKSTIILVFAANMKSIKENSGDSVKIRSREGQIYLQFSTNFEIRYFSRAYGV